MNISKTSIYIVASCFVFAGCSKIEHGLETAEDIKASTVALEEESSAALMKQKESGAVAAMGIAIEKLKISKTSTGRLTHATRYFAAMPFQFVHRDEVRQNYHYKISLADFLSERFSELSEGRTEYFQVRTRKSDGTMGSEDVMGTAQHTDIKEDYNPSHFPELAALAIRMHYISDDQKEMNEHPKSFMELLKEVLDASAYAESCEKCKLENFKPYVQANMQFSGELIDFLQLAHNSLSIAGLKGVVRSATNEEKNAHFWYGFNESVIKGHTGLDLNSLLSIEPTITQSTLVKDDTNIKDIKLSQERLERAAEIRGWLTDVGITPIYSKFVYEDKFGKYLEQAKGSVDRAQLSNEKNKAFSDYVNSLEMEYENYKSSF